MKSSASCFVVVAALAAGSAQAAEPGAGGFTGKVQVPLGEALKLCLSTETPLVADFFGVESSTPIRFTYVRDKDKLDAYVFGNRDTVESAKEPLQQSGQVIEKAATECAATFGVTKDDILGKLSIIYAYKRPGKPSKPIIIWHDKKYEIPG